MQPSDPLRDQIHNAMELKTTEELVFILEQDDHEEWTETAFEEVRKILIERTGNLPESPVTSMYSSGKPAGWETVNWQAVSYKCGQIPRGIGLKPLSTISISFLLTGGLILASIAGGLFILGIAFLLAVALYGVYVWLYRKAKEAKQIAAQARVYLKDSRGRNRGSIYDVGFAIKSAFVLCEDGELVVDNSWKGHRTFAVPASLYDKLEEQDIVNIIFLSNGEILGLLEDFEEKMAIQ